MMTTRTESVQGAIRVPIADDYNRLRDKLVKCLESGQRDGFSYNSALSESFAFFRVCARQCTSLPEEITELGGHMLELSTILSWGAEGFDDYDMLEWHIQRFMDMYDGLGDKSAGQ